MGLPRVLGCCAPLLYRGKKWGEPMARYIPGIKDPISGRRETRLRPPPPGPRQSCRACRGTCPDVLPLWMTRFPAGVRPDSRPARDPSPATVPGTPAKLPGVLGHVPRCVAVIEDLFSGQGRPVSGRRRPVSSHRLGGACQAAGRAGAVSPRRGLASFCRARAEGRQAHRAPHRGWRPGRCVRAQAGGPADVQDVERHGRGSRAGLSLAWARH